MGPSPWQLLIILVFVALIFGTKKLRNIGGDLGGAIKGFKKGLKDDEDEKSELEDKNSTKESAETHESKDAEFK